MKIANMKNYKYIWGIIGVGAIVYLITMHALFNIAINVLARFLLLNILSILLPGFALLSLLKIRLSRTGVFCTSYMLGYAGLVAEYFFSELFNRKLSFVVVTVIVAIFSVLVLLRKFWSKNGLIEIKETGNEKLEVLFLMFFTILNIFAYAANYLGTDVVPVFGAHRDMQYWANNTVALKIAWPADNLFMMGNPLQYHYFSNIPIAFLSEVYKIDVFTMSFPLYSLTKAIVMVGAVQFLVDTISDNKRINLLGYILLIFSTGAETISGVTFVHHTLLSPFGFDVGYAYGMFAVGFLLRQWYTEDFDKKIFLGLLLAWTMCVGAKAPVAAVMLLFVALLSFYWLIHKKRTLAFGYGLSILGLFLLICKYCVGMFSIASGNSAWTLGLYGRDQFSYMGNAESWDFIGRCLVIKGRGNPVLALLGRTLSLNPALAFGVIVTVIWVIFQIYKKKIQAKDIYLQVSLGLTAIWGLCLWHLINAGGASEMYFAMTALIPMSIMIIIALTLYLQQHGIETYAECTHVKKGVVILSALLLQLGIFRFSWSGWSGVGALRNANDGFWNFYTVIHGYDYSDQVATGVRNTDVEALSWIRDNADSDALIMTDKAVITGDTGYYVYGIFCERQQYIEGTNMLGTLRQDINEEVERRKKIVVDVYTNAEDALINAKNEGIDYIVQTVDITPEFEFDGRYLELVSSSKTMNIYKVKQ